MNTMANFEKRRNLIKYQYVEFSVDSMNILVKSKTFYIQTLF
jgi:hypothetical protein